jgi:hypothetical protein
MTTYRPAPAVERIANDLIPKHHAHLADVEIRFLFVDPPAKSKGAIAWGTTSIVSGRAAYLLALHHMDEHARHEARDGADYSVFVIEIAEAIWLRLEDRERQALVDHELSHCWAGENDKGEFKLSTRGHDVEEFHAVVERHGMWRKEIKDFAATVEQLTLADRWGAEPVGAGE